MKLLSDASLLHLYWPDNLELPTYFTECMTNSEKILPWFCRQWTLQSLVEIYLCMVVDLVVQKKDICADYLVE